MTSCKKAFTHASSVNTLWWQKLSLWLSQHGSEGVLAEGTFSLANAEQQLMDKRYHSICQSSATEVSFFMDNMFSDSNVMASYLRDIRPSASLFSLIKFRLGGHSLRVETDRPNHLENNVFFVTVLCKRLKTSNISFLTALFTASLEVSISRYLAQTTNNGTLGSFSSRIPTSLVLFHTTYTCAFKPGCLMSHNWLHTPDCKVLNENENSQSIELVYCSFCTPSDIKHESVQHVRHVMLN